MAISKSDLKRLEKDSREAARAGDEDALTTLVLAGLRQAETASQLWSVATSGSFNEATLGEDVFPPAVVDTIIKQVATFTKPADRASGLSLAVRITAFSPVAVIEQQQSARGDKPSVIEALSSHRSWLREELASSKAVVRAVAALALARCGDRGDAAHLLADLGAGPEAGARLIGAAALGADVTGPARALLNADDAVARACAACALGLTSQPVADDATAVLTDAIVASNKLPPTWGWRWRLGNVATTRTMACVLLRSSEVAAPASVVQALCSIEHVDQLVADTLGKLAFPAPPDLGVALEDLDEPSRNALRTLAQAPRDVRVRETLHRLGLPIVEDVAALLDGTPPFFAPTVVDIGGNKPQWHVARLWRERVRDGVSHQLAIEGIVSALSVAEIYELLVSGRHQSHIGFALRDVRDEERSLELAVGLFEHLQQADFALRDQLSEGFERRGRGLNKLHLAVGALVAFEADLPSGFDETLAMGLVLTHATEPVGRLLNTLDEDRHAAIAAAVESKRV